MVREALLAVGVLMLPSLTSETRGAKNAKDEPVHVTEARLSVQFVSLADNSEVTLGWEGMKIDKGDKSLSIAATLGLKQLLLKTFCIVVDEELISAEDEAAAVAELETARDEWKNIAAAANVYKPVFDRALSAVGQCCNGALWRAREGVSVTQIRQSSTQIGKSLAKHQKYISRYREMCVEAKELDIEPDELLVSASLGEIESRGKDLGIRIEAAKLAAKE